MKKLIMLIVITLVLISTSILQAGTITTIPVNESTKIFHVVREWNTDYDVYMTYLGMVGEDTFAILNPYLGIHGKYPIYYPVEIGMGFIFENLYIKLIDIKWNALTVEAMNNK